MSVCHSLFWRYRLQWGDVWRVGTLGHWHCSASHLYLVAELQGNAKDFHRRFHAIKESTIQCLEGCKFSVVTLVYMIRSVCTSEHKKSLEEGLYKTDDYRKLFGQMDPYWDYLSFDLLAILVKELSLNNASFIPIEDEITVYKKDLQDFKMHTTLTLFCQALPHEDYDPPQIFLKMVTEYQWPETVTLEDVEMFMKKYSLPYKLQTLAMMVNSVMSKMETRAATSEVRLYILFMAKF